MFRMNRLFGAIAFVCLTSAAFATVTVSGNLVNPATGSVSSRAFVRFWIRGCGGNQARVSGTGVILPSFTDLTPTAGAISGTLYDSLTEISCGGSVGATWYGVQAFYDGKPGPEVPYNVTGASFNLNNATPNTTSPVVAAPTGDATYVRLDGGNNPTGTISPSTNGTLALGGSSARWKLFADTINTNKQFTSSLVTGTAPLSIASTTAVANLTLSADTQLPTISTAGKVSDTALSSNVALYNNGSKTWGSSSGSPTWTLSAGSSQGFTLAGSNGASTNSSGIYVQIAGGNGNATGSGSGGEVALTGGQPGPSGGGGDIAISAGQGGSSSGNGGPITLQAGSGQGGAGNGGSISLGPGLKAAGGSADGTVKIGGATSPALSDSGGIAIVAISATGRAKISENGGAYGFITEIPCVTSQKSESAADTNVLTCTPPAVAGSYRIRFTEAVSAQNTATLGWTATWKDANGSAQAPTNLSLIKSGTAAPALTFVAATNDNYYATLDIDVDNSATAIIVKTTFAGTSFTSKVTASVERIN